MASPARSSSDLFCVLDQFAPSVRMGDLTVQQIGEGGQAVIYAVRSRDSHPVWEHHRNLVIKMYRPALSRDPTIVQSQFELLDRLNSLLDGSMIKGWRINSPTPLYVCASPPALLMTCVPGTKLLQCLTDGENLTPGVIRSIAETVISSVRRLWSFGEAYGELNFDNVLCDLSSKDLSFVDLGMPAYLPAVDTATKQWYPACHDLGYLLHETASAVLMSLRRPRLAIRVRQFTTSAFEAFLKTIGPVEERELLLDEARIYARAYLNTLEFSWSARGLWCLFVRPIAVVRMHTMLRALRKAARRLGELDQ